MADTQWLQASHVRDALTAIAPASWAELANYLEVGKGKGGHRLRRLLKGLEVAGEVEFIRHGREHSRYRLTDVGASTVTGVVALSRGRLVLTDDEGTQTPLSSAKGVRPGDAVQARISGSNAEVLQVTRPTETPFVGIYRRGRRNAYVEPVSPGFDGNVDLVSPFKGSRDGDLVEAVVIEVDRGRLYGKVTDLIRHDNEAGRAAEAMLRARGVPTVWPDDIDGMRVRTSVTENDRAGREDLRKLAFVTIDGDDARDFDDAVHAQAVSGGWRLWVAIADVGHYVRPGSALDDEALARGNSVYLPDRVVPMLPEDLSNGICSLRPLEDRLVVACEMTITREGLIRDYRFAEAVIFSHARLTYTEVAAFLSTGELGGAHADAGAIVDSLTSLHDCYGAFRAARSERGALDFESHETAVLVERGKPVGVELRERTDAHCLIEEAMIAANVASAMFLEERQTPLMYRVHEPPRDDKLEQLRAALSWVGIAWPVQVSSPKDIQRLLEATSRSLVAPWIWQMLVLRSLEQACYQPDKLGHFGLALPRYAHFTSPIRRYADLVNHRLIKSQLHPESRKTVRYDAEHLREIGAHISMTERRAEDTSRAVDTWLKCALVEDRVGEVFEGTVVGVAAFGLFVELDGVYVQALLHISKLGNEYYQWLPQAMSLVAERSGVEFSLGQRVNVVLEDVSVETGKVDVRLAGGSGRSRGSNRRQGSGSGKRRTGKPRAGTGATSKKRRRR